jgi:hypothetical protein
VAGTRAPLIGIGLVGIALVAVIVGPSIDWPGTAPRDEGDLPSCGAVDLRIDSGISEVPAERSACLFDEAAERSGAELEVITSTDEGASIHTYYRRHPDQAGLEIMEDHTADRYSGSGGWTVSLCPHATGLGELGLCALRE